MPEQFDRADLVIDEVLRRAGRRLLVGLPIGIGKPVALINELYRRAAGDPSIDLTFLTGLTLTRPRAHGALERRFLDPFVERVFGADPEPLYAEALRTSTLPPNIRVIEFFFTPGSALGSPLSQQQHLADNYTEVTRALLARGVNVVLQLVASRRHEGQRQLSLGANPDVTAELVPAMRKAATDRAPVIVGQVHPDMPFMLGDACVAPDTFDLLLEHPRYNYRLFAPPNLPLADAEHAIGVHASSLLADGGTLQIGIGELGDAVCYATLLRHQRNEDWQRAVGALAGPETRALAGRIGGDTPFATGLFGCSEMFLDQLLDLARAGVLRREVHDCLALERALASEAITERFGSDVLERLLEHGLPPRLDAEAFAQLQHYGVFHSSCRFDDGALVREDGERREADLSRPEVRQWLAAGALGRRLKGGVVLHSSFLLGPQSFYAALRALPESERSRFHMNAVGKVNRLGEAHRELHRLQRRGARFINSSMMVTLLGAAISDGLDDGRVVSGVGGQLDFILQARDLPDARTLLCLRATRSKGGQVQSNLRMAYGHATVPRHLRDIVITEYGAADLRDRTDAEVVAALLGIADSRFQPGLLAEAQRAGKIAGDYRIPDRAQSNTPERIADALRPLKARGQFSQYPFGTDFTKEEIALAQGLKRLAAASESRSGRALLICSALMHRGRGRFGAELARMGLASPRSWRERLERRLVSWALAAQTRT